MAGTKSMQHRRFWANVSLTSNASATPQRSLHLPAGFESLSPHKCDLSVNVACFTRERQIRHTIRPLFRPLFHPKMYRSCHVCQCSLVRRRKLRPRAGKCGSARSCFHFACGNTQHRIFTTSSPQFACRSTIWHDDLYPWHVRKWSRDDGQTRKRC
jgi:hypothetical protein